MKQFLRDATWEGRRDKRWPDNPRVYATLKKGKGGVFERIHNKLTAALVAKAAKAAKALSVKAARAAKKLEVKVGNRVSPRFASCWFRDPAQPAQRDPAQPARADVPDLD